MPPGNPLLVADSLKGLGTRIEAHLSQATGAPVVVRSVAPLGGGACQDNYRLELTFESGELQGDRTMVLRCDARRSLAGSIDRKQEFEVVSRAVEAGVKTPKARFLAKGLTRDDAWGYFLDWVPGEAIGRRVLREPKLAAARSRLAPELAVELAAIHSIEPRSAEGVSLPRHESVTRVALDQSRAMLDSLPEPRPALELALDWLASNAPKHEAQTLVHGDFRLGNFMVAETGLAAVLDWEFAHWGSPFEDLAWICLRDWRFGRLDLHVGGFAARDEFFGRYQEASGRTVNRRDVHWYEVLGNVRWAIGCVQQGERYLSGAEQDLELIAIPLHGLEIEFEALRVIERGA